MMRQLTFWSRARWIMSGWLATRTTLLLPVKRRFSEAWGMATTTLPLMLVGMPLHSLTMRPSKTLTRLNTGRSSTRVSTKVSMLKVAMSPAESIP